MKISLASRRQAKILILCIFTTAAVGVMLLSFLQLGQSHENFVARSQSWNLALPAAEAGLEEALTQLNYTLGKKMDSNGWAKGKGKGSDYERTRVLNADEYYRAMITDSGKKSATVTSIGYIRAPGSTNYISRTIVANTVKTNMVFTKAMVGRKHNDFIGSCIGKCIHLKHDGTFHFDEAVRAKESDYDVYRVSSWTVFPTGFYQ